MKLWTKELERKAAQFPLGSQDGKGLDATVFVKFFNPYGAGTWLCTSAKRQEDGDYLLFGYCHIFEWEFGYVMLSELENLKLPFGLTIERDLYSKGTVRELCGEEYGYEDDMGNYFDHIQPETEGEER